MAPMDGNGPPEDYLRSNPETEHNLYKCLCRHEWAWYLIWGRTSCGPGVSDSAWKRKFENHFGREAGKNSTHRRPRCNSTSFRLHRLQRVRRLSRTISRLSLRWGCKCSTNSAACGLRIGPEK